MCSAINGNVAKHSSSFIVSKASHRSYTPKRSSIFSLRACSPLTTSFQTHLKQNLSISEDASSIFDRSIMSNIENCVPKNREKSSKRPSKFQAEQVFRSEIAGFTVKTIMHLKKILDYSYCNSTLIRAFLLLLKSLDYSINDRAHASIDSLKSSLSNAGALIQRIRKLPEYIKKGKLCSSTVVRIQEILKEDGNAHPDMKNLKIVIQASIKLFSVLKPFQLSNSDTLEEPHVLHVKYHEEPQSASYTKECKDRLLRKFFNQKTKSIEEARSELEKNAEKITLRRFEAIQLTQQREEERLRNRYFLKSETNL